jgi:hypothetical protein
MPTLDVTNAVVNAGGETAHAFRERRRRHTDGAEIETVEGLHKRAEQHDAQLQCAEWLVFERLFDRRPQFTAHGYPLPMMSNGVVPESGRETVPKWSTLVV